MLPDSLIHSIALKLMAGFRCYLEPNAEELIVFTNDKGMLDYLGPEAVARMEKGLRKVKRNSRKYILLQPMPGYQYFSVMEDFLGRVQDSKLRAQLTYLLTAGRPMEQFTEAVEQSPYAAQWAAQREQKYMQWVRRQIKLNALPDVDALLEGL